MNSYLLESTEKKSRIPARLDFLQSGTGLILGLFMWVHMLLVGSIILGKGVFNFVAKTMEFAFLSDSGQGFPIAVFFAVSIIFTLFIAHALLGVRKFPISWKQHRIIRDQMQMMNHQDTNLWYIQVVTGFLMFFLGSVHLYVMLTNPGAIDPYLSADRIVSGNMWPLYLTLLICVELHGTIGLYRLCMKWGWFTSSSRKKLKTLKNRLTIFFLTIGILALLVFIVIGMNHRDNVGQRYDNHVTSAVSAYVDGDDDGISVINHEDTESVLENVLTTEALPEEILIEEIEVEETKSDEQVESETNVKIEEQNHVEQDQNSHNEIKVSEESYEPKEHKPATEQNHELEEH